MRLDGPLVHVHALIGDFQKLRERIGREFLREGKAAGVAELKAAVHAVELQHDVLQCRDQVFGR